MQHRQPRDARVGPAADDAPPLLRRRLRIALLGSLLPILLFALTDLRLSADDLWWLYGLKLLAVAVIVAAWYALRPARTYRAEVTIGLLSVVALYALSTASAILGREVQTTPLLNIAVALATATLLPWGVGPQLVVVATGMLSTALNILFVTDRLAPLLDYPNVGIAIGLMVSVYVAHEFQLSRTRLARKQAEQQRAEAEVRTLNRELEARVAERTAQLARANRDLEEQVAVRTRAEAELRRSEAALSAVIENTGDVIWSVDRNYQIVTANQAFRRYSESVMKKPVGPHASIEERLCPPWLDFWRRQYDRALNGERFAVEHELKTPDGTRYYLARLNPIIADGTVTGVAAFGTDITERRRAEEAARQHHAELAHVLRLSTMGEMAAGLAHEINQPLGAIANYAQGCSRRLRAGTPDLAEVLAAVDSIAAEAIRAGEIIRRLRTLIRKDGSRQQRTDLNVIVTEAVRLVESEARQQEIVLRVRLAPDLPHVLVDGIQIEQVVLNLLRNGIDALADTAPDRRSLSVSTACRDASAVEIAVRDTGRGLPPALGDRVFDPFVSTKPGGLGMGLSISRTIVEQHGGRLWATGDSGGTTFRLTLPISPQPRLQADGRNPTDPFGPSKPPSPDLS